MNRIFFPIVIFLMAPGCGNSEQSLKEKELELKERELALKEKELHLQSHSTENSNNSEPSPTTKPIPSDEFTETDCDGGTYIPEYEIAQTSNFQLKYNYEDGANRPNCEIIFSNGPAFFLISSCAGDYFWCLRDNENNEVGSMRILFSKDGKYASIAFKESSFAHRYKKYVKLLKGKLERL